MFRIGQKCVCVDADSPCSEGKTGWKGSERPINGKTYTVHRVFVDNSGTKCLWLNEIRRCASAIYQYGPDTGYAAVRFRPIVSNSKKSERDKIINNLLTDNLERV